MDCQLFLKEKADFFERVFGLKSLKNDIRLLPAMESAIKKTGMAKPFLIVPFGLTHKIIQKAFREKLGVDYVFPKELDDLKMVTHERWPVQSYFIRHGGHKEATRGEEELEMFAKEEKWRLEVVTKASVDDFEFSSEYALATKEYQRQKRTATTSLETSLFSFEYTFNNGGFIDVKCASLALGSRRSNGDAAGVYGLSDRIQVYWCKMPAGHYLCSRTAEIF